MFCRRLSALISVLWDIFTVELATTAELLLTAAELDLTETGTAGVFPGFCDEPDSAFPSVSTFPRVAGRAEKAPPLPQPDDGEVFVSVPDGLVAADRLLPLDGSVLDLDRSDDEPADEVVVPEDRLLRFLARLARPTRPLPASVVSFTTVG